MSICACHTPIVLDPIVKPCGHKYHRSCANAYATCILCDRERASLTQHRTSPPLPTGRLPLWREITLGAGSLVWPDIRPSLILTRKICLTKSTLAAAGIADMDTLLRRGATLEDLYLLDYKTLDDLKTLGFKSAHLANKKAFPPACLRTWYNTTAESLRGTLGITADALVVASYTPKDVMELGLTFADLMTMGLTKSVLMTSKWDLPSLVVYLGSPKPFVQTLGLTFEDCTRVPQWPRQDIHLHFGFPVVRLELGGLKL